jgi:glutathione S-transferase
MTIELHVFPPSPRAFKVLAVANHLDLPFETRLVQLTKGDQRTAEFTLLNPNQRMPVLKDGDYVLWEANAITQYLALKRPESGLLPTDDMGRLDVTRWQFWDLAHWDPACAISIFERVVKPAILGIHEIDEAAIAKGTESFNRAAGVLNHVLEGREYVTGDTLTVADFSLGAVLNLAEAAQIPVRSFPEIGRWYRSLCALPAWQKTLESSALPG